MSKEQELYDKFVDALIEKVDCDEPSAKDLDVVFKFIQYQNLKANPNKNPKLGELADKLPFEDDNVLPLRPAK